MSDNTLFPVGESSAPKKKDLTGGTPRLKYAVRNQVEFSQTELDNLIAEDHPARSVWMFVEQANLNSFYQTIRAVDGHAGRPAIDPRILLALWIYATIDGVGSAREVERLCEDHVAYRWLCGGVSLNYHTLADFRSGSGKYLDTLLTESVTRLVETKLVTLNRVAHDGLRVRASAGKGSFARKEKLDRCFNEAREQVKLLRDELDDDPGGGARRKKAARERVALERQERVAKALSLFTEVQENRKHDKEQARVSMTDPDARKMRMPDGGWRPGYNVQFSVDTASQIIVQAGIGSHNSDGGLLLPAVSAIKARYGRAPCEILTDAGFSKREDVVTLTQAPFNCTVYMPQPKLKTRDGRPILPKKDEADEVKAWRARMETAEAQKIYKERCSTVECVNALARNRGLQQLPVRGLEKTKAIVLLYALAHNVMRTRSLTVKSA